MVLVAPKLLLKCGRRQRLPTCQEGRIWNYENKKPQQARQNPIAASEWLLLTETPCPPVEHLSK